MAQASDIFSHLRQNHGDLHQNHGDLHRNHGSRRQNHGDLRQNHGHMRQNHGHLHRNHGNLRQNHGDLHRSSSNECCYSAAPAPSLRHTNTATQPRQHRHFAAPAPSLHRTRSVILAAAKPGETLSGIVTEVKSLTWDFAGSSTKWPENA